MKEIFFLINVAFIIIIIYLIVLIYQASSSISNNYYAIDRIFSSWKAKPIANATTTNTRSCSSYQMEDLVYYEWPGTYNGCDCTRISYLFNNFDDYYTYSGNLYAGSCTWNMTMVGCVDLNSIDRQIANKWRNSRICGKYMTKNYFELEISMNDCSKGFKKCGKIDTLDNYLCIKDNENCPIIEIYFPGNDYESLSMIKADINTTEGRVITNFKATDERNCINDKEEQFYEYNYILMVSDSSKKGCSSYTFDESTGSYIYYDNSLRYFEIDKYNKKSFYQQNSIYYKIKNNLPLYPDLKNAYVGLYGETYIGWKKECKLGKNPFNIEKIIKDEINIKSSNTWFIWFCLILILLICFFVLYILSQHHNNRDEDNIFLIILTYIISLIIIFIIYKKSQIVSISQDDNQVDIFSDFLFMILNRDCSDYLTNLTLRNFGLGYYRNAEKITSINKIALFLIISLIFYVSLLFLKIFNLFKITRGNYSNPNIPSDYKPIDINKEEIETGYNDNLVAAPLNTQKDIIFNDMNDIPTYEEIEILNKKNNNK